MALRTLVMHFKVSVDFTAANLKRRKNKIRKEKEKRRLGQDFLGPPEAKIPNKIQEESRLKTEQDIPGFTEEKALNKIQKKSKPEIILSTPEEWLTEVIYQISIKDSQYNKKR